MPNVRLAWLTDANEERASQVARLFGVPNVALPEALTDLPACDAVLLAIPVHVRPAYYETLGRRGIAVLAEKPFAASSADHDQFEASFAPWRIGCGFQRRMHANTRLLRRVVAGDWFGPLRRLVVSEGDRVTRTGSDTTDKDLGFAQGGGALFNIGVHSLDQSLFIADPRRFEVCESNVAWDGRTDRKVSARVRLAQLHGRPDEVCEMELSVSWLDPVANEIVLEFDRVTLSTGGAPDADVRIEGKSGGEGAVLETPRSGARTPNQAFYLEWEDFLLALAEERPSTVSAASCRSTTSLAEELLRHGGAGK
jgi:predicted dehydrogenase